MHEQRQLPNAEGGQGFRNLDVRFALLVVSERALSLSALRSRHTLFSFIASDTDTYSLGYVQFIEGFTNAQPLPALPAGRFPGFRLSPGTGQSL